MHCDFTEYCSSCSCGHSAFVIYCGNDLVVCKWSVQLPRHVSINFMGQYCSLITNHSLTNQSHLPLLCFYCFITIMWVSFTIYIYTHWMQCSQHRSTAPHVVGHFGINVSFFLFNRNIAYFYPKMSYVWKTIKVFMNMVIIMMIGSKEPAVIQRCTLHPMLTDRLYHDTTRTSWLKE